MARIAVVGAGMGGLACAARLAALGHDVTVLEQADTIGGKCATYEHVGFRFDIGPSLLTLPAVYRDLFVKTGAPLERVLDLVPLDPVCHYRFADGTALDLPAGPPPRQRAALDSALGAGAGEDWARLLGRGRAIWQATRGPFLESALDGPRQLLALARRFHDLRTVAPWRSLRGLGRTYLRDPRLRLLLDRYATYTGSDPRRAPAALAVVPFVEQTFGAWYVPGGLGRLTAAVHERALERGVTIRTGARVAEVLVDAGRAAGVRLDDGTRIPADVVVANADASIVYERLVPSPWRDRPLRRLRRATPSLSGFLVLLALRGRTPGLRHHTVLFPADYDAEFDAVFGRRPRLVPDPTVYVAAPDDPALRPNEDCEACSVLVDAPRHGPVDWRATGVAQAYAEHVLDVLAARGLDVRGRVLWRGVRTPADLQDATGAPGGAIYGSSSNGAGAAFLRPANRSPLPGLFLVGGSAHPGGGLPLVALSAAIVADLVGPA